MFRQLSETEEWQTYTETEALLGDFLSGDALQDYFIEEREKHRTILQDMGEVGSS
jgi:tripartite-type tricarboxylate transporter receptor subunit TctC